MLIELRNRFAESDPYINTATAWRGSMRGILRIPDMQCLQLPGELCCRRLVFLGHMLKDLRNRLAESDPYIDAATAWRGSMRSILRIPDMQCLQLPGELCCRSLV
jgi:hypothetical protein